MGCAAVGLPEDPLLWQAPLIRALCGSRPPSANDVAQHAHNAQGAFDMRQGCCVGGQVNAGQNQTAWEQKGWIKPDLDPRGWFQW